VLVHEADRDERGAAVPVRLRERGAPEVGEVSDDEIIALAGDTEVGCNTFGTLTQWTEPDRVMNSEVIAFARAVIIADRKRRVSAEPEVWYKYVDDRPTGIRTQSRSIADEWISRGEDVRPLYLAPPPTPPADALVTVEVERGRVWIKRGVQSWMLAYKEDEPAAVEWYAQTLRKALEGK